MQALAVAGPVLGAIGGVMQGTSYLAQGKFNSAIAERNANYQLNDGAAEESQTRTDVRQTIGQQLVSQGGSGFEMGTGSNVDAIMQSQVNGMLDALTIRRKARAAADNTILGGQLASMEAKNKATASFFGAAQSLVGGAAKFAGS